MPERSTNHFPELTRALVCLLLFAGQALSLFAEDLQHLRHQAWSTEDGLPQNSVHQVVQTRDGFLWVATEAGIARFDGVAFRSFSHLNEPAFVSDDTCCLAGDTHGDLWVGTTDGLLRLHDQHFERFSEKDGLPSTSIRAILARSDGSLHVLTSGGLAEWKQGRFASVAQDFAKLPGLVSGANTGGWSSSNTTVSLTSGGSTKTWKAGRELPGSRVETVFVDRAGTAWVGTNDGLATIPKDTGVATPIAALDGNTVLAIFEDREGNDWIGGETSGLHVLRRLKFRAEPLLTDKALTTVVQATDGAVWVGTREDGLRRLRLGAMDEAVRPESLTSPVILSLAPGAEGGVWAGTPDGLNHVDARGAVRRFTSAEGMPDDYIQALAAGRDGSVWAGTRHGLVHLHGSGMEILTRADGLGGELIGTLLLARDGALWAGTSGGLSRRGPDGGFITFTAANGPEGIVSAMAQDGAGRVWVGTKGGGLGRFVEETYRPAGNLRSGGAISGIAADGQGYLWLREDRGIERVLVADLEACAERGQPCAAKVSHYGVADGMPSEEIVAGGSPVLWRMANGELWTATRRGAAIADPEHLPINSIPPLVAIERFLVDESEVDTGGSAITLPYGHTRFTMEYAGLSYTVPSEVRYRFMLEGFDPGWTEAGARRIATYTNLPARAYTFRVQAMNNDGVWSEVGATLGFRVIPPFYRRFWFLFLVLVCLGAVAAGLYQLRLRRLQARFHAVLDERNRMAREIHDTLAQDFVGVSIQLDLVSHLLGQSKVDAALQQVRQTRRLVTEGLADARQSIWELRANLAQDSLPTRLAKVVERYSHASVAVRLKIGGAFRKLDERVEGEVLRIAQEALSNVQRHAEAANASIELHYGSDMLVLTIEDDGRGFSVDDARGAEGHYGLSGMRERAGVAGGRLEITSAPGAGTKIRMSTPIAGAKE